MSTPKKLNDKQKRVLNRLFEEHTTMDGEFVVYQTGWNDRVVAVEARKLCAHPEVLTDNAVASHRRRAFGNFRRETHTDGDAAISSRARITQLQAEQEVLIEQVGQLHAKLQAVTARVLELEQKQLKLFSTPAEPRRGNSPGVTR